MKRTKLISVIIVLVLVFTMSIGLVYADAPDEFSTITAEKNFYYSDKEMVLVGNFADYQSVDLNRQLKDGKAVYVYDISGTLYDFYQEQELKDTYALVYYYGADGVLNRNEYNLGFNEPKTDAELLSRIQRYLKNVKDTMKTKKQLGGLVVQSGDGSAYTRVLYDIISYEREPYGYIVMTNQLYRAVIDEVYFYRVENMFQFVPGFVASKYDSNYESKWQNEGASIEIEGVKVTDDYTGETSAVPNSLDYWPKHAPNYRTITSGYKTTMTIGNTSSLGGSIGEDGFGLTVDSKLSSTHGLEYFYQETYTGTNPTMSAQYLPSAKGTSWAYYDFTNISRQQTLVVYPGALFETMIPSSYEKDGIGLIRISFHLDLKDYGWGWEYSTPEFQKILVMWR